MSEFEYTIETEPVKHVDFCALTPEPNTLPTAADFFAMKNERQFLQNLRQYRDLWLYYLLSTIDRDPLLASHLSIFGKHDPSSLLNWSLSPTTGESVFANLPSGTELVFDSTDEGLVIPRIADRMRTSEGNILGLGYAHGAMNVELETAIEVSGMQDQVGKIGLVVIDTHLDTYEYPSAEAPHVLTTAENASVVRRAVDYGVGAVSILGANSAFCEDAERRGEANVRDQAEHPYYYAKNHPRISIVESKALAGSRDFSGIVRAEVQKMKEKGVRNIVFSLDLDAINMLREGILCPASSPVGILYKLHTVPLDPILDNFLKALDLRVYYPTPNRFQHQHDVLHNAVMEDPRNWVNEDEKVVFNDLVQDAIECYGMISRNRHLSLQSARAHFDLIKDRLCNEGKLLLSPSHDHVNGVLSLLSTLALIGEIRQACREDPELTFGIRIGPHRYYFGNISELQYPDSTGNAARLIQDIANMLT